MRSVQRLLYAALVSVALLAAAQSGCLARQGPSPAGDAPPAAGQEVAGYPAPPQATPDPSPEGGEPRPYPAPSEASPPGGPVTVAPTDEPLPTETPFWNWPTPVRPEGPATAAWPVRGPAPSPQGALRTFVQAGSGRSLQRLTVSAEASVTGVEDLASPVPPSLWEGPVPGRSSPVFVYASPGGQYLALASPDMESDLVYVVELATGEARQLETVFQFGDLRWVETHFCAWHPDARHVYLADQEYGMVFLIDVLGEEPRQYVSEALARGGLAITPDGQLLAYATLPLGQSTWTLWFSAADGAAARPVLEDADSISVVSWSPDGTRLLLSRGGQLWLVDRDGGNLRSLGVSHTGAWGLPGPQWSPDGGLIAYAEEARPPEKREGEFDPGMEFQYASTYLVDAHTGERRPLAERDAVGDLYPAWSPDGSQVAFLSGRSGAVEVWMVAAQGGEARQITTGGRGHALLAWAPIQTGQ